MLQIQMVWAWFSAKADELRTQDPDRGEIVNTAVVCHANAMMRRPFTSSGTRRLI